MHCFVHKFRPDGDLSLSPSHILFVLSFPSVPVCPWLPFCFFSTLPEFCSFSVSPAVKPECPMPLFEFQTPEKFMYTYSSFICTIHLFCPGSLIEGRWYRSRAADQISEGAWTPKPSILDTVMQYNGT